jgi:hypothetical protein
MAIQIKKAVKHESKLRLAIIAPSGAGKTYTSLVLATVLAQGKPIAVIDTERGSASKYADLFDFDVVELESFSPRQYVEALKELEKAGYAVIVVDSLSHAWMGKDGALEMVDKARARERNNNSFTAWRDVTPEHNALIEAIIGSKAHVIATMRQKTEYVLESVTIDGKTKQVPRKVGLAPIQRDGMEYEFDVVGDMDQENTLIISKSRCPAISNEVIKKPGKDLGEMLLKWLAGAPAPDPKEDKLYKLYSPQLSEAKTSDELALVKSGISAEVKTEPVLALLRVEYKEAQDRILLLNRQKSAKAKDFDDVPDLTFDQALN